MDFSKTGKDPQLPGKDMVRALMTMPGQSVGAAVRSFTRKTGKIIHDPRADQCYCDECVQARMTMLIDSQ